jgi:tritrans,polycis-undecaprenyl-diphosphate synthase [geranylgeranyl-diphosphate specific]
MIRMNGLMIPNHIAVILDGNRRWAKERGLKAWKGHRQGSKNFEDFIDWCLELNVPQVSAYVLSTENLNRPKREVLEILRLLKIQLDKFEGEKAGLLDKYEVKVRFCGDFRRLPSDLVHVMKRIMKKTEKYNKKFLNILVAYGGRFELTEMVKKMINAAIKSGRIKITEKSIEENLLVSGDVELVIRTGGMNGLSNLLPWQTSYAEIYTTETLWPDFTKRELMKAIKWFNKVKRNFGK